MSDKVLAAVRTAPSRMEIREFPMPEIADDAARIRGAGGFDRLERVLLGLPDIGAEIVVVGGHSAFSLPGGPRV